jgi:hypothetical protein
MMSANCGGFKTEAVLQVADPYYSVAEIAGLQEFPGRGQ